MNPNELLALLGGVIVAGFIANVIFRVFKIPSVVKLMGIGLLLGPVFQVIPGEQFMDVAPIFGKIALLIILFAGGLGLRIKTVIAQLGNAVLLALLAFGATFAMAVPASLYIIGLGTIQSIILATLVAGTASSIVIPVVTKLSVKDSVKTMLSIESALSNLLILVVVIIACDIYISDNANIFNIVGTFLAKIGVSLLSAVIAGVIWARLIGSLKESSLSYMLTLGFIFLLNYLVDLAGGSGAISILFFGIVLANVSTIADQLGPKVKQTLGIEVDSTKFVLNEFLKGISGELSFLVATFFFTFLGLLVNFEDLTPEMWRNIGILTAIMVVGRLIVIPIFARFSKAKYSFAEAVIMMAMMPRGLATAVMAFRPAEEPYFIDNTSEFPLYAMIAILGSNLLMTGIVKLGESLLKKSPSKEDASSEDISEDIPEEIGKIPLTTVVVGETGEKKEARDPDSEGKKESGIADAGLDYAYVFTTPDGEVEEEEEEKFIGFTERLLGWLNIQKDFFLLFDHEVINSIKIRHTFFWVKLCIMAAITILGLLMNSPAVVIAALLLSPITWLTSTISNGIITGDVYIFLKALFKFLISAVLVIFLSAMFTSITPFTGITEEISSRIQPHVLDFFLALITGMVLPVILLRSKQMEIIAITPVVGLLVIPPLATVGFAFGAGTSQSFDFSQVLFGGLLSFAANFVALMIGAVFAQIFLGLSKHTASDLISTWKEEEVEHGALHGWFERLRLVKLLESVGTFRARLIVLGIMAVAVFVPLQITYNKLQKEYRIDQAISRQGKEFFEREDGSSYIVSRNFDVVNDLVEVTLTVTTAQHYSVAFKDQFEEKLESEIGLPCKVRLIQFDVGAEDALPVSRNNGPEQEQTFAEQMEEIQSSLDAVSRELPALDSLYILNLKVSYNVQAGSPEVLVQCFTLHSKIHSHTRTFLRKEIGEALNMETDRIRIIRVPGNFEASESELGAFIDPSRTFRAASILRGEPRIQGDFAVGILGNYPDAGSSIQALRASDPILQDTSRFRFTVAEGRGARLRLK